MKKISLLFMAVLTLGVTARAANGDRFTVDNLRYTVLSEENKTVSLTGTSNEKPEGELIIPQIVANESTRYMVTEIYNLAFLECIDLTSITIPATVIKINGFPFQDCHKLSEIIVAGDNTAYSSIDGVLFNKNKTTLIHSPQTKESFDIPNTVTEIGAYAFYGCTGLTSVTIPNSVIKIGGSAFCDCTGLTSIYCYAANPPALGDRVFYNVNISNVILHVVKRSETAYQEADIWNEFFIIADLEIESGIESIEADSSNAPAEYFKLNGVRADGDVLSPGLYIKRQGGKTTKVLVK